MYTVHLPKQNVFKWYKAKNKFLPTLYIRKCKITYLECFAIIQTDGCYGQLFSSSEAGRYGCTLHAYVRMEGVGADKWTTQIRQEPCEVLSEKGHRPREGGCTCSEQVLVNQCTRNTERKQEKRLVYVRECTCMCEWFVISASESKKKRNPTEWNSCPQHQLPEEILSWGFWFPPSRYGSCVGKFKSVHPIELHIT